MVLFGTWLVVFGAVLSASATINSYYLAALSPPVAGLIGIGGALAWRGRRTAATRMIVAAGILVTSVYAFWLLPASGTGLPGWLAPVVLGLGVASAGVLTATVLLKSDARAGAIALAAAGAVGLLVPVVASVSVVTENLGAFDTPFQPAAVTTFTRTFFGAPLQSVSTLPRIEAARNGAPDLMATQTSVLAAPFIYATGQEVLPIGGYTGAIPSPTVAGLESMVAQGRFHLVLTAEGSTDPRVIWIADHCLPVATPPNGPGSAVIGPISVHFCTRSDTLRAG